MSLVRILAFTLLFTAGLTCIPNHSPALDFSSALPETLHYSQLRIQDPSIQVLANGVIEITAELREACSGGEAYAGVIPDAGELAYPIYRISGVLECPDLFHIRARIDLREMETPRLDINHLRDRQGGRVATRLILFSQGAHIIDRVLAYSRDEAGRYQRAAALIEGPFVDCVTDSGAIISFEFDLPVAGHLRIQPGDLRFEFAGDQMRHEISLAELSASSAYTYAITYAAPGKELSTANFAFRTAPPAGANQPLRFAVMCDGRVAFGGAESDVEGVNAGSLRTLLNLAYTRASDFIIFPGDLIGGGSSFPQEIERQFRSFQRIAAPVGGRIPIYEGMGNHDLPALWIAGGTDRDQLPRFGSEAGEVLFAKHFVNPQNGPDASGSDFPPYIENVYSFDWGASHFVMLNSNYLQKGSGEKVAELRGQLQGEIRAEQLDWLERDLQAARQRGQERFFVFSHEPAFPNGGHVGDGMWWNGKRPEILAIRDHFWKILCDHQVTAAFFGDEHNYSRTLIDSKVDPKFDFPVWQIVTGGAGAPYYNRDESVPWAHAVKAFYPLSHLCLVEVAGPDVWLTVLSEQGTMIERVNLSTGQP